MKLKNLVFQFLILIPGMTYHSFGQTNPVAKGTATIYPVNGNVPSGEIKLALTHEHIMSFDLKFKKFEIKKKDFLQ